MMMEEVVLEGEVEGGGKENKEEEQEHKRLSGSILKDDSIVLFEAGEGESGDKDLLGSAPELNDDSTANPEATISDSTILNKQNQELVSSENQNSSASQDADSKEETEMQLTISLQEDVNKVNVNGEETKEEGISKKEAEDQKIVIELLRQQVRCLSLVHVICSIMDQNKSSDIHVRNVLPSIR